MRRREFIAAFAGAAAAWPLSARAQAGQPRVGVLMSNEANDPEATTRVKEFEFGLQKLGLVPGRNLVIDYRFGAANSEQVQRAVSQLIESAPNVILAHTPSTVLALKQASRTIPIVFVQAADPVALGIVSNLVRPDENVTGFVLIEPSLAGKWLQVLLDVAPGVTEVLVLAAANNPSSAGFLQSIETVARSSKVNLKAASVSDGEQIERSIIEVAGRPGLGLVVLPGPVFTLERKRIIGLTTRHRIPAVYPFKFFSIDGGLVFYGADNVDQWRQAASYVDRILRGAHPRDLPIQLPTKFELVINQRTANAIGLTISRNVLLIADEVIE